MKENSVNRLLEIVKRLRAPDGCPWDREQTHKSVRGHLVEECAELLEAIDNGDDSGMREELGDVLMHILLHCEIADERGKFDFYGVAEDLANKLVRRHPHVFGERRAESEDDVLGIWKEVKASERKKRVVGGLFDGIPPQLSALRYALDIAKKADSETLEKAAKLAAAKNSRGLEIGKKLFDCVREAAAEKIEPEGALRDYISEIGRAARGEASE
mgnify:FL=1